MVRGAVLGSTLGTALGEALGVEVGRELGEALGEELGPELGAALRAELGAFVVCFTSRPCKIFRDSRSLRFVNIRNFRRSDLQLGLFASTVSFLFKHITHPQSVQRCLARTHVQRLVLHFEVIAQLQLLLTCTGVDGFTVDR
jgi:hypothetical protein